MSVDVAFRGVTDSCKIHGTRTMAAYRLLLRRDKSARARDAGSAGISRTARLIAPQPDIKPKRRQQLRFAFPAREKKLFLSFSSPPSRLPPALSLFLPLMRGFLRAQRDLVIKYA